MHNSWDVCVYYYIPELLQSYLYFAADWEEAPGVHFTNSLWAHNWNLLKTIFDLVDALISMMSS